MQLTRTTLTFMGTQEEYCAVAHLFETAPAAEGAPHELPMAIPNQSDSTAKDLIRRVLKRIRLEDGHRSLFRALYAAGEAGLSKPELADQMGRTEDKIPGVLGALGRRINNTPGVDTADPPGMTLFLDVESRDGTVHYALRSEVRTVLREERLV